MYIFSWRPVTTQYFNASAMRNLARIFSKYLYIQMQVIYFIGPQWSYLRAFLLKARVSDRLPPRLAQIDEPAVKL